MINTKSINSKSINTQSINTKTINTKPINTRSAPRRELSFHCTGCLKEELARIEDAHRKGTLTHTGNWTAGENLDHVAKAWEFAIDGFQSEVKVPWFIRLIASTMKGRMTSGKTLPAGFKMGKGGESFLPTPGTTVEAGLGRLRAVVDRLDAGTKCTKPSPAFGALTHDQWMRLNLGHAQLHLGFVSYP